jgi:hypothetical protein
MGNQTDSHSFVRGDANLFRSLVFSGPCPYFASLDPFSDSVVLQYQ